MIRAIVCVLSACVWIDGAPPEQPPAQPPASPPASTPPPQNQPPGLLAGPTVVQEPQRLTLVHRSFDGKLQEIDDEIDATAIGMLNLTDEQRAKYNRIAGERTVVFDQAVRRNYAKIAELAAMRREDDERAYLKMLSELARGFAPYRMRGTFTAEMEPFLTPEQLKTVDQLVDEYIKAKTDQYFGRAGESKPGETRARLRLETFAHMVRHSIERQVAPRREAFEQLVQKLNLTPEQQGKAQAILQPLGVKAIQGQDTTAEFRQAMTDLRAILTPDQRQQLFALLVERFTPIAQGQAARPKPPDDPSPAPEPAPPASPAPPAPPAAAPDPAKPQAYKQKAGPHEVVSTLLTWRDEARERNVDVKIYFPEDNAGPRPVIVFSPGLGGTREGYAYASNHWASYGYVCVNLEHEGSDRDALRSQGAKLLSKSTYENMVDDPNNWINRAKDVSFAIDQLARLAATDESWRGRLDLARIGAAGHSFGAFTTMTVIGTLIDLPSEKDHSFRDARIKAAVVMSPQSPGGRGLDQQSWSKIATPCLYMFGTKDEEITGGDPMLRRGAYDDTSAPDQYLLIIKDAEHYSFSDNQRGLLGKKVARNPAHFDWIHMASTAFFDAYLLDDKDARAWLKSDALPTLADGGCTLERK